MTASIWSTPPGLAFSAFPALTLLRFMHNHHLLQLLDRPTWLTIEGGSHNYVRRVVSKLPDGALRLGDAGNVHKVRRDGEKWIVHVGDHSEHFHRVIFACHADTALALLDESSDPDASAALANFKFSENEAVLHADEQVSARVPRSIAQH
jgi:predicted NAD/FAD-binding protein